mmetsp:Transcript_19981/g.46498  ORF Transcript_19981/g.46498 Transcript_19981/m.46498 type:complete len:135 (+) Transcript_19981:118-522(+)
MLAAACRSALLRRSAGTALLARCQQGIHFRPSTAALPLLASRRAFSPFVDGSEHSVPKAEEGTVAKDSFPVVRRALQVAGLLVIIGFWWAPPLMIGSGISVLFEGNTNEAKLTNSSEHKAVNSRPKATPTKSAD